ncbi:MAG TPA: 3-methyl-2-oxobutanoate hydroxymethyltransferase [Acidimicrobiia bacterium]|nr:3-methyl-2-oxobutanoate hydroxymethyltransferase [Acidimicrobiia bacterium]
MGDKVTVPDVRARKGGPKLTMVTAYDYPSARMASEAGLDMILVGDSVANVFHGMEDTLGVDIDIMVLHAQAVRRAQPDPLVVVDMPWLTFHISREDTLRNAGRLVREGGAEAVKLEGGNKRVRMIEALVGAEIPVMGHLGLTPQSVHAMGGYRVQGRELEAARTLIQEAKELEAAGVFSVVLEGVPDVVARMVTEQVSVPTIGIGAGPHCDGQVLVYTDLLGLGFGHYPKFVRRYEEFRERGVAALTAYVEDVRSGAFPGDEETYHLADEVAAELEGRPSPGAV